MNDFTATHFRFEVEAITELAFDAYTGSALRGALVGALQRHFCPASRQEIDVAHQSVCPVCWLLSYEANKGDSRRPYAIEPLLPSSTAQPLRFEPGQRFQFGLTLFGQAAQLFPYLVLAVPEMGRTGIGQRRPDESGRWRRGRFVLRRLIEVNPLSGVRATLMAEGQQQVQSPQNPVTWQQVLAASQAVAERLAAVGGRLGLRFLTPTRIVQNKRLVHEPLFRPLFQRLLERINELQRAFGDGAEPPDWAGLLALAEQQVQLAEHDTFWWDVQGHSQRLGRPQNLGGYVGLAWYEAEAATWEKLLPWLVWGMSTHVGKNAVKGSGWYSLRLPAG